MSIEKGCIKTVPAETWARVIDLLVENDKDVYLVGGPDDKECIDIILKNVRTDKFKNLYGTTKSLKDLSTLISSAETFLCSDSAPLHIAVALNVKTFVIFGPTNPKTLTPESENVKPIMVDEKCPLKPCLWERRQTTCETINCLDIKASTIVKEVLGKKRIYGC